MVSSLEHTLTARPSSGVDWGVLQLRMGVETHPGDQLVASGLREVADVSPTPETVCSTYLDVACVEVEAFRDVDRSLIPHPGWRWAPSWPGYVEVPATVAEAVGHLRRVDIGGDSLSPASPVTSVGGGDA